MALNTLPVFATFKLANLKYILKAFSILIMIKHGFHLSCMDVWIFYQREFRSLEWNSEV